MRTAIVGISGGDAGYTEALARKMAKFGRGFAIRIGDDPDAEQPDLSITVYGDRLKLRTRGERTETVVADAFGNVRNLCGSVRLMLAESGALEPALSDPSSPEIVCVLGARGGCGTTSVAIGLAQHLKRYCGREPLYVPLTAFGDAEDYFPERASGHIEEYIYRLLYGAAGKPSDPSAYISHDGYGTAAFAGSTGVNPLIDLTPGELSVFLTSERFSGADCIILDLGSEIGPQGLWALRNAMRAVAVTRGGERPELLKRKLDYFRAQTGANAGSGQDKFIVVHNFCDPEVFDPDDAELRICDDKNAFITYDGGTRLLSLDGDFGAGIARTADAVFSKRNG